MSRSQQKSKDNDLGNKTDATTKKFEQGFLRNWCDVDTNSSKTIDQPPPYGRGAHNYETDTLPYKRGHLVMGISNLHQNSRRQKYNYDLIK